MLEAFGWPMFIMNNKQGMMTKQDLRKAVQAALNAEDMLAAAFGKPEFYALNGAMYPKGYVWRTEAGTKPYNQGDADKAAALAKKAGYDGTPIRILTSRQYEFHYKMAQVAAEYLKAAGLKVDLQVVDWATLVQRRAEPALWDIFITHSPFLPEPALIAPLPRYLPRLVGERDQEQAADGAQHRDGPEEARRDLGRHPEADLRGGPLLQGRRLQRPHRQGSALQGFTASPWPYFWNASLKQ